jgi:hypothetical protein
VKGPEHQVIIDLPNEHLADVLVPILTFPQHFIQTMKKELEVAVVSKLTVTNTSSKIGQTVDTTNEHSPNKIKVGNAEHGGRV